MFLRDRFGGDVWSTLAASNLLAETLFGIYCDVMDKTSNYDAKYQTNKRLNVTGV